ncbi:MAG: cell division protein ZapE, partial [Erythrobacter sp.]
MSGITARYDALIAAGELQADDDQRIAVEQLAKLQTALEAPRKSGFFARLVGTETDAPRGIYMWGGVGRGKSMLMDLFHETLTIKAKRRVHFHAFMQEVHGLLREERKKESGDPIPPVAASLGRKLDCLNFDEMVVNNSADAMFMSRLFRALI